MRKSWTDYVASVKRKGNRGKNSMSHVEAMRAASVTWPKEKAKILRRRQRECKKRPVSKPPAQIASENEPEIEK